MRDARPALLGREIVFPDPASALRGRNEGLLALGGDLSAERLLAAYRQGIFPWSVDPITWWSPDPRGILALDELHVSRSLQRVIRQARFRVTFDTAFRQVMEGCAQQPRVGSWIAPEFLEAYSRLHEIGYAHSVEAWRGGELAGGVYGVAVGGLFAGESMFHRVTDASKVALAALVGRLRQRNFALFDIQMVTLFMQQMGGKYISRSEYLARLKCALERPCCFG